MLKRDTTGSLARDYPAQAYFLILGVFCLLVLVRVPAILSNGRVWGEDGRLLEAAFRQPFFSMLTSSNGVGYRLFYSNSVAWIAHLVPLEYAPFVFFLFAMLILALPLFLLALARRELNLTPLWFSLAALCFLLVIPNYDSWLTTVTSGFLLSASGAVILISPISTGVRRALSRAILVVGAMTGLASLFLLPPYLYRWSKEKQPERLVQASIIALFSTFQFWGVQQATARQYLFSTDGVIGAIFANQILLPLIGFNSLFNASSLVDTLRIEISTNHLTPVHYALIVFSVAALFFAFYRLAKITGWNQTAYLLCTAMFLSVLSIMGSLEGTQIISLGRDCRYFYVPNVLVALAILFALRAGIERRGLRYALAGILFWILGVGAWEYFRYPAYFYSGPKWADEIARWREDPTHPIVASPPEWVLRIQTAQMTSVRSEQLPAIIDGGQYKGPVSLSEGKRFAQRFQASSNGLIKIGIQTVTWGRSPKARDYPIEWDFSEVRNTGKIVRANGVLQARTVGDWTMIEVRVPKDDLSQGKWFEIGFLSPVNIYFDHSIGFPLYQFNGENSRMMPATMEATSILGSVTAELRLGYAIAAPQELSQQ